MPHDIDEILADNDIKNRLEAYDATLHKWQKTINLVAPSTLANSWDRHILDSLAFVPHIGDEHKTIVDIGSGAGFPALVLAMAYPEKHFIAIDSDERKVIFMQSVSRETMTRNIDFVTGRAEEILPSIEDIDLLTARALAPLGDLITFLKSCRKDTHGLFTKGLAVKDEILKAQEQHDFHYEIFPHSYSAQTRFVKIML